jgi:transcriptional regulator with XRE-family HTH domain
MAEDTSWDEIRRQRGLNEEHVAAYGRLGDAEERLHAARRRRGVSDATMAERLGVGEDDVWAVDQGSDLYLFALARHVAAAGGRLELRAVFDDEEVLLLSEPPQAGRGSR